MNLPMLTREQIEHGTVSIADLRDTALALWDERDRLRGLIKAWADAVLDPSKGSDGGYFDPTKRHPVFAAGDALLAEAKQDGGEA